LLRDPRDGPQLPFAFEDDYALWHIHSLKKVKDYGIPPQCMTQFECWEDIFLYRFRTHSPGDKTMLLDFIKIFSAGGKLKTMNRSQLLADKNTFFYNWLKLAGLPLTDEVAV